MALSPEQLAQVCGSAPHASLFAAEHALTVPTRSLCVHPWSQFERDGLIAVPDFFDVATAAKLRERAKKMALEMDLTNHPRAVFVTGDEQGVRENPIGSVVGLIISAAN